MIHTEIRLTAKCSPKHIPPSFLPLPLVFNELMRLSGNFMLIYSHPITVLNRTNITITISGR